MKKLIVFLFFTFSCVLKVNAYYIYTSLYKNGYWSTWKCYSSYAIKFEKQGIITVYMCSASTVVQPFVFRLTINNYCLPEKKIRKEHMKNNISYDYSGYLEYWIDDEHMDFSSVMDNIDGIGAWMPSAAHPYRKEFRRELGIPDETPSIVKKSPITIKIMPYEGEIPVFAVYNIWCEGVGFAFYMYDDFTF